MTALAFERPRTEQDFKIRKDVFVATLAHIEVFPERHDQGVWRCGSSYCFGGWAAQVAGFRWLNSEDKDEASMVVPLELVPQDYWGRKSGRLVSKVISVRRTTAVLDSEAAAMIALGITYAQSLSSGRWLFSPWNNLDCLYRQCAEIMGIQEKTLRKQVQKYIQDHKLRDYVARPLVAPKRG